MSRYFIQFLVVITIPLVFSLFRRWAPRDLSIEQVEDDGRRLPYGVAGTCMWILAILIAVGGFYALYGANRLWASFDNDAVLSVYPDSAIWCFLPGFATMLIPWITTLWLLRRFSYAAQAAEIVTKGNAKMNVNGERVMHWLAWGILLPIAIFTLPAIPMHLTIDDNAVKVTHYRHVSPDVFKFTDARDAYLVDGYALRDGTFKSQKDLIIRFADGKQLSANAVGDGGSEPSEELISNLLSRCHLNAIEVKTSDDIPKSH